MNTAQRLLAASSACLLASGLTATAAKADPFTVVPSPTTPGCMDFAHVYPGREPVYVLMNGFATVPTDSSCNPAAKFLFTARLIGRNLIRTYYTKICDYVDGPDHVHLVMKSCRPNPAWRG